MIENILKRNCKQTAVYWGNPISDGFGGFTFDDPIEIACRWENKTEVISDATGKEIVSHAQVIVLQDVTEQGYLYLGTLEDSSLDSNPDDPREVDGAYIIKVFDKEPSLKLATEFFRKVYLQVRI